MFVSLERGHSAPTVDPVAAEETGAARADVTDHAILKTLAYAGLFQFPLTVAELHQRLMEVRLVRDELEARLGSPFLQERLERSGEYVFPRGQAGWIELRRERRAHTERLLARHARILSMVKAFPFVRLVALSGGCAHDNAMDGDVDVFLVVRRRRAWTVTLALMVLAKVLGLRRTLCVNYVVDEAALALPETDRFTATEMTALRPLAGRQAYLDLLAANPWVAGHYPNAADGREARLQEVPETRRRLPERLLEVVAPALERLAHALLGWHLRKRVVGEGVSLSAHRLKLHGRDNRPRITDALTQALQQTGL